MFQCWSSIEVLESFSAVWRKWLNSRFHLTMATTTIRDGIGMETHVGTHSKFIVKTKQTCAYINNNKTEVVCSAFEDYIFLIVTQYMKIGTLVHVYPENTVEGQKNPLISTRVIFGKDESMTHVLAKNIHLGMSTTKPVMMSIALKDKSQETVFEINKLVHQCKVWV